MKGLKSRDDKSTCFSEEIRGLSILNGILSHSKTNNKRVDVTTKTTLKIKCYFEFAINEDGTLSSSGIACWRSHAHEGICSSWF